MDVADYAHMRHVRAEAMRATEQAPAQPGHRKENLICLTTC